MSRLRSSRGTDDGVALVMVLMFLALVGIFAAAALGKGANTAGAVTQLRTRTALQYALDGGVDRAYQVLLSELASGSSATCAASGSTATLTTFSLNNQTVTATCSTLSGRAYSSSDTSSSNYALVVTSPNPGALTSKSAVSSPLQLEGSVYLNGQVTNGDLSKPLEVTTGDLVSPATAGCVSNLSLLTSISLTGTGQLRTCTEQSVSQAMPTVVLPAAPTYSVSGVLGSGLPVTVGAKACQVFYPGKYTVAPNLSSDNYFVSGLYSFVDIGTWQISNGDSVIGGQRSLSTDTALPSNNCTGMTDTAALATTGLTSAVRAAITPYLFSYGTTWVFGGNSNLDFKNGDVTLFSPPAGGSSQPVNVVGATAAMTGYVPKAADAWLITGGSKNTSMIVNSKVYAPTTDVSIFSTNKTQAAVGGGIVAYRVDLQASASGSGGIVISAPGGSVNPPPPFRTVKIVTADASGTSSATNTSVATISNYWPYTVHVLSWRTG